MGMWRRFTIEYNDLLEELNFGSSASIASNANYINYQKSVLANQSIAHLINDTLIVDNASIETWLRKRHDSLYLFQLSNFNNGLNKKQLVLSLTDSIGFSQKEIDFKLFRNAISIDIDSIKSNVIPIDSIYMILKSHYFTNSELTGLYSENMLCFFFGECNVLDLNNLNEAGDNQKIASIVNNDQEIMDGIKLYPNPTESMLFIESENYLDATVSVIDFSGRVVYTDSFGSQNHEMNVGKLTSGIYLVKIIDGRTGKTFVERIIID